MRESPWGREMMLSGTPDGLAVGRGLPDGVGEHRAG